MSEEIKREGFFLKLGRGFVEYCNSIDGEDSSENLFSSIGRLLIDYEDKRGEDIQEIIDHKEIMKELHRMNFRK